MKDRKKFTLTEILQIAANYELFRLSGNIPLNSVFNPALYETF